MAPLLGRVIAVPKRCRSKSLGSFKRLTDKDGESGVGGSPDPGAFSGGMPWNAAEGFFTEQTWNVAVYVEWMRKIAASFGFHIDIYACIIGVTELTQNIML